MEANTTDTESRTDGKRFGWPAILGIIAVTIIVTVLITAWVVKVYFFTSEFKPVTLDSREEQVLNAKLERLEQPVPSGRRRGQGPRHPAGTGGAGPGAPDMAGEALEPEPYSEAGASRTVEFTERELNAMLAKNTDLARRVAVDLSDDLVSAKILVPMDPDFPIMGGKTLRVNAGVEFGYGEGKAIVRLRGISLMGVPLPNAWLGGLKNIDLVREFGTDPGFWKSFSDGIEDIQVRDGRLLLKLKE